MSRIAIMAVAGVCALAAFANDADRYGGTVRIAGKGRLAIVDCRSGLDWNDMKPVLESFDRAFHVEVVRQEGDAFSVETAAAAVATCEAEAEWIRAYEPRVKRIEVTDVKRFFEIENGELRIED